MPWLVHDSKVLATLEVADSLTSRSKGLLGRDGIEGALLLSPARSVHTVRMRFAIDVAFLDARPRGAADRSRWPRTGSAVRCGGPDR